ncbi:DNA polymerase II large subunit [Candidatus Pacearchaeota archaeon]|nr:DNA polymerase II large subunit [Candidatus Pacearchaeota archaeon]
MEVEKYFKKLEIDVNEIYSVAEKARKIGLDPVDKVEIPLARSLAEKVVGLISTIYPQMVNSGIAERIIELEKEHGKLDPAVCLQIAEDVAKQKFCKFSSLLEAITAGVRVGFAYITLSVVSSPIEGLTEIKLMKTKEDKEYFALYFSGPVRSAGGTGAAFSLVIADHLREIFGFEKYDPTEEEVKRTITELNDYHERITNLQYMPTDEEISFLASSMPLQISGEPSEKLEVSNHKNLDRIETNFIRSGFCLTLGEGLAQKAAKILRYIKALRKKGFKLTDWDFLEGYIELHKKRDTGKTDDSPTYIKDLVAGRPVFGHPSRSGAFRFRYGRGRVSGFSAASLHPATMGISDDFIAIGTQLKIEKPTKGCAVTVCDSIDGPIVKLTNGSVRKLKSEKEARELYKEVDEIIYLGDILFPFSDLANRNYDLIKPGYVEEWWKLDLQEAQNPDNFSSDEEKINPFDISFEKATALSKKYNIPLNPKFIFYWTEISKQEFFGLIEWIKNSQITKKIIFPYNKSEQEKFKLGKRALELLGIGHEVTIENVVLNEEDSKSLFANLGIDLNVFGNGKGILKIGNEFEKKIENDLGKNILEIVNILSDFEIKDKAGDFIGTRMGRPEKAKVRKLTGSPNVLFPVGKEGGRLRSVQAACEQGKVKSSFPIYYCEKCKKETIYPSCEVCGIKSKKMFYCRECDERSFEACKEHEKVQSYSHQSLDINHYFQNAVKKLGLEKAEIPLLIKGIRGTSSEGHTMENLAKGILRALFELQVNKDGTIRFDMTELPLVSFKPKEVSVNVEKLIELGYDKDVFGKDLVNENQILELMPHDILLPSSPNSPDERADDVFIKICNFVDSLLTRFYGLEPFYNVKKREDLIGQLGVCMAPHNCAGVICRVIGFSNSQGLFASPYMHAAIRRDCDGDEAAVMLLGDVLLNFSRKFLPSHRGGTQDAPLVLNSKIDAGEVDDQILDLELTYGYPLELYQKAEKRLHSSEISSIETIKSVLKKGKNPFVNIGFTHDTSDFNNGVVCSSYKILPTMQEKVQHQMELVEKIRAVDTSDTARLIIERHFIKDIKGNLRKFSMQQFRCVACNEIMRRPPLTGVCSKCGGKIIFTIHEGGIKKYLEAALNLAEKYNLSSYLKQNLELIKRYIDSIFGRELEKQEMLERWF